MLRINELKLPINHDNDAVRQKIVKLLKTDKNFEYEIVRKSLDARKKDELLISYVVDIKIASEKEVLKRADKKVVSYQPIIYSFPYQTDSIDEEKRPVIIGMGPAGLFAGLYLAKNGYRPIIYERGKCASERKKDVETFWKTGKLSCESNVQFGEGGAGTFSDGKLNTMVKEKSGRLRAVLKDFVSFGAPNEILISNKPHIGTDILVDVVTNIRNEIIKLGGEVHFDSKVTDFSVINGKIDAITINDDTIKKCDNVILAIGHSARDTFIKLKETGLTIEPKSFAVGLRVTHNAKIINKYVYGKPYDEILGNESYKVTHTCPDKRGVYSFCMCPGGYVVNASSEEGRLCVNGMSYSKRDSDYSNSAIIITVKPEDYMLGDDPLSGMYFQRDLEKKAYELGKGKIPVETYGEFKDRKLYFTGEMETCSKGEVTHAPVHEIFPQYMCDDFVTGMEAFGKIINGFNDEASCVYGVESRTSSPIRMVRNENGVSNIDGLFVCGEGAGYAGGIMSAAMDGIKIAECIAGSINHE